MKTSTLIIASAFLLCCCVHTTVQTCRAAIRSREGVRSLLAYHHR